MRTLKRSAKCPLPDGKVYGPITVEDTTYHTRELLPGDGGRNSEPILGAELADKVASNAFAATKGSIYDAIDEAHEFAGVKRQKKNAFERIVSAPGVVTKKRRFDGAHYPKDETMPKENADDIPVVDSWSMGTSSTWSIMAKIIGIMPRPKHYAVVLAHTGDEHVWSYEYAEFFKGILRNEGITLLRMSGIRNT